MGFANLSLMVKIISAACVTMILLILVLFGLYWWSTYNETVEAYVGKARSICLTTESVREKMDEMWASGIFTTEQMRAWKQEGAAGEEKILAVVPVVTAWRAAMMKAEAGGYEFRVPKVQPRNPANEPDEIELAALRKLKGEDGEPLPEYHMIDGETNSVRYFLPVRLTESCLMCHGDPKTSEKLWGRDDGKDILGRTRMENWKAGSVHGAFEVIQSLDEADASIRGNLMGAGFVAFLGVLAASGVLALVIARNVTGPITAIVDMLNDGANQVADASGQISAAGSNLAENATSQAASIEETSAALEEMASMTRQNADNATQANQEMGATTEQVATGGRNVRDMAAAMGEINQSSEQIQKIISVIEEIAFQTNLLALNAAVEAARAGEAGKGFAVVADEVRNLSQRSAQAARDTASLIEGTVERVGRGGTLVKGLETTFREIEKGVDSVNKAVAQISTASSEQAQGIDQVNSAVAQIDKVTQTMAATSEESASAAEELSAQSDQLKQTVRTLLDLVRGG